MNRNRLLCVMVVMLLAISLLPARQAAYAAPVLDEIDPETVYVPGEVVITMPDGMSSRSYAASATTVARAVGAQVVGVSGPLAVLSFAEDADVEAIAEQLTFTGQVEYAQPNYIYMVPEFTDQAADPVIQSEYKFTGSNGSVVAMSWDEASQLRSVASASYTSQALPVFPNELPAGNSWGWDKVEADLMWNDTRGNPTICLLDTGVEYRHPDLSGVSANGYDYYNNDSSSADDNGHGTHLAGVMVGKANNGAGTVVGISRGKVLAVKVLNSQGVGTSYSVSAGINYCGRNSGIKVINLSLGTTQEDTLVYNALRMAVSYPYYKLVVAAAGNSSVSTPLFPAAWADATQNGPNSSPNEISAGLISVAAGRAPSPYTYWVDRDADRFMDPNEQYTSDQCASGMQLEDGTSVGSNYGSWVNMVAPGDSIYGAMPMYTPFYLNYYKGYQKGYDTMSGSSVAAAFVSGAAARVFAYVPSTKPATIGNAWVKQRLLDNGDPLTYAVENNMALDPAIGFDNPTDYFAYGEPVTYGVPFDIDDDDENDTILAPFCWPTTGGPFTSTHSMANTKYLNVAAAMGRAALYTEVKDAITGMPLTNATVGVMNQYNKIAASSVTYAGSARVLITNIPMEYSPGVDANYWLVVNMRGYTAGWAKYENIGVLDAAMAGNISTPSYSKVSLAPANQIQFVLDWIDPVITQSDSVDTLDANLDMYMFLPVNGGPGGEEGIIGTQYSESGNARLLEYIPGLEDVFLGQGTLLEPSQMGQPVTFFSPFALFNLDGGVDVGADWEGNYMAQTESITVKMLKTFGAPNYAIPRITNGQPYTLVVTDYSRDGQPGTNNYLISDPAHDLFVEPVVRVWSRGYLIQTIKLETAGGDCPADANPNNWNDTWQVLTWSATMKPTVTNSLFAVNQCGRSNDNFLPYYDPQP